MVRICRSISVALVLLVLGFDEGAAGQFNLQAGVGRVDLTPPLEMKASLGGYGARMSKPTTGIHDSVWAKALVLKQGERKFALVTADVLGFPPGFKAEVIRQLAGEGWRSDQVMLLPSHTHTSIDLMALHPGNTFNIPEVGLFQKALFDLTAERLARVVREASKKPMPMLADCATVEIAGRNRNRRAGGRVNDPGLTVTRIDTSDGRPLAALVNWTAHPTFMDAEDMLFSGDWPGNLQRTMEALIGQQVTVMYYNGAEGDQSPTPPADCNNRWERAERYGREMAITAWRTWEKLQPHAVEPFNYHTETILLPERKAHPDFMKTGGAEYGLNEKMMPEFLGHLLPAHTHSTCLRLGDLVILGVPGEMAAGLGMEIKTKARETTSAHCVTIGGLSDEWISYILSAEEYRKGGYEASMSSYGETLGTTLVKGITRGAQRSQEIPHLADYDSELRGKDGRVDIEAMVERLKELGVSTYYWLIWHAPTDWEDLKLFLPRAAAAHIQVWVYLVPPSESQPQYPDAEPFKQDYQRWAEEIARLSLEHKNLTAWVIDDFYANHKFFTPAYVKEMESKSKGINPRLKFLPLMYFPEISARFVEDYHDAIDGVVAAYPRDREEISQARAILNGHATINPGEQSCPFPLIVMTAGVANEFKQRHGEPASPERMAQWLQMCLKSWREGDCDGVVTYCLEKGPESAVFQLAQKLFREYR